MLYVYIDKNNKESIKILKKQDKRISSNNLNYNILSNYKDSKLNNIKFYPNQEDKISEIIDKIEAFVVFNIDDINKFISYNKKIIILYDSKTAPFKDKYKNVEIKNISELLSIPNKIKENKIKLLFKVVLLFLLISIIIVLYFSAMRNGDKMIIKEINRPQSENYVLLGDSITEYYNEDTYYCNLPVVNSGIAGDGVDNVYNNLKKRVYQYNPTKVFILIGTNDLTYKSEEYISEKIGDIVKEIKKNRKSTEVYVESIYPINNTADEKIIDWMVGQRTNDKIMRINKKIKEICETEECKYINIYDLLLDENGNLKIEYTTDGLHISEEGYKIITNELKKYMNS